MKAGSLTVATGKAALQIYEANAGINTAEYNRKYGLAEWNKEAVASPVLSIVWQKFPWYLAGYLEFVAVLQKNVFVYSTISRETPNDVLQNAGWKMLC
jgi:hypothetical protein